MKEWIGHYRIVGELGRGGMGVVYRAHEESLGRDVAIKVLGEHLAEDQASRERFLREARSAAALNHPNIVQIYAIAEEDGAPYFVMEYVDGTSLQRLLREQGRLDWLAAVRIVAQAASGLEAAHERGIIHRDIKPANLLIDRRGLVKIADFGLALAIAGATRLTATGMMMGTPGYLSPEQCRDRDVDQRTDIYSLGVTFYEMLTGEMPFSADSPLGLIKKIVEVEPLDVRALNPEVDPAVGAVLQRMMAKDRDQRYESCRDVIAELEAVLAAHGAPSSGVTVGASAATAGTQPTRSLDAVPTAASDGQPPPLQVTSPLPVETAPAPPPVIAEPPRERSRALPLLIVVGVVLLASAALGVGGVVVWRTGLVSRVVARIANSEAPSGGPSFAATVPPADAAEASPREAHGAGPAAATAPEEETGTGGETSLPPSAAAVPAGPAAARPPETAPVAAGGGGSPPPERQVRSSGGAAAAAAPPPVRRQISEAPPTEAPPPERPTPEVASRGVIVVAVGEPLLAGEAERYLEAALRRGGAEVVDESSLPDVAPLLDRESPAPRAEARAAMARHARHLLLVRAEYLGERPLAYMDRSDAAYEARLTVAVLDLAGGRPLAPPFNRTVEYTHLTVERVVASNLRPWLRQVAGSLDRR